MRRRPLLGALLATPLIALVATSAIPSATRVGVAGSGLGVSGLTANAPSVSLYEKFEVTFQVDNSVATNFQFPYDPAPPPGLAGRIGITVDGLFLPPGTSDWSQAIVQPGFLYQDYQRKQVNGREWLYPQGSPVWKIRFSPRTEGVWQYKVRAQDASICSAGANPCPAWIESGVANFTALPPQPNSHGFLQVSKVDPRYFVLSDGLPFVGLGHNTSFNTWNFTYDADQQLARYAANGLQLFRVWMDGSAIAGSSWEPWVWFGGPNYASYIPDPGLWIAPAGSGYDFTLDLTQQFNRPALFNGWSQGTIAVKPNTTYQIRVKVATDGVTGPADPSNPTYGFTVKIAPWPSNFPASLAPYPNLVPYVHNTGWTTLQGTFTTGAAQWFLDYIFLLLDNTTTGNAHVGEVTLREVLPGGNPGPNLLVKSSGDAHLDFNLLRSWDWDYVLDQAAKMGVYFKLVTLEKSDRVWDFINADGTLSANGGADNFYARDGTKVRRLHEYFWRYLAARWGYATAIHSWELCNEGDPYNGNHYDQTNKFAAFMHQFDHNHLVTTSFWHSYPASEFWNNPSYPSPDYADLHAYTDTGPLTTSESDDAGLHIAYSQWIRSFAVPKPTIRGETGINTPQGIEDPNLAKDRHGVWLHNLTWAQLDSGGMYDLVFYADNIVANDLYFQYKPVRDFLQDLTIANGHYRDAQASASAPNLRVVGQKDLTNQRAHLWIQNVDHNWSNVVNGVAWGRLSGTVTLAGFTPGRSYPVSWWEFDDPGNLTREDRSLTADASGNLVLDLSVLKSTITDVAVKIDQPYVKQLAPILK
ncbi:MAG TPA: hypothetical protein VFZ25_02215 [Chloroflexota bacterium]|nr:hypothetical protein [Chloroflexota bacterium]